jgi:aspartate aminotransferase-like enzyme
MNLRIPGPTPLPAEILAAHGQQIIDHRGLQAQTMIRNIVNLIKNMAGTSGDVYLMTSSGWGGVESILVNTVSPGEKVLTVSAGHFGEVFGKIATQFGAHVENLAFPDGSVLDPDVISAKLKTMSDVKAVLITHNESYTGVLHPLKEIAAAVRANSNAMLFVDAVSSLGAVETKMDEWGVDAISTASQKALMGAPGLSLVAVGERAWQASLQCKNPRYYWDWRNYHENMKGWTTPSTTALTVIYGLAKSAEMIEAEGFANVYARHERVASFTRQRILSLGLELFAKPNGYSPTLTAVKMPDGINSDEVRSTAREHGVEFGASWGRLQGKILRIGHMGMTTETDIDDACEVLGDVIALLRRN